MTIFGNFFEKNVKFLAIFWQSNGNFPEGQGSGATKKRNIFTMSHARSNTFSDTSVVPQVRSTAPRGPREPNVGVRDGSAEYRGSLDF